MIMTKEKPAKGMSVVIPVMNEEENIQPVYHEVSSVLKQLFSDYEIIFVNDGSTDNSLLEMLKIKQADPKVKVIDLRRNFGQSAAMRAGFDYASKELVCYIDGDMQIDFNELPLFLKEIENGADAVTGWRWKRKDTFFKRFFSLFARQLRKFFLGTQLHDYGCPFKVFKKECLEDLELFGEMHRYIPPMLRWKGYNVSEVKITHRPRIHGKTKYNITRLGRGFLDMIAVWFWQKFSTRPLHIFGGIGLASMLLSGISAIILASLRLEGRISLVNSSLPLLTAVLFLMGVIFLCFGLVSDMLMKIYYSQNERKNYNIKQIYE